MDSQQLTVGNTTIAYNIRVGSPRRQRLAIRVTGAGLVEVLLPPGQTLRHAREAVRLRADWIVAHVRHMQTRHPAAPPAYVTGEKHLLHGEEYLLEVLVSRSWQGVSITAHPEKRLVVSVREASPDRVARVLHTWYRDQARRTVAQRLEALVPAIHWLDRIPAWQIKTLRRRWGSCNAKGLLTFNTHLVKVPPVCFDYVIMHEIAHLRELNHSPAFYAELAALMPQWKSCRKQLNLYAHRVLP